VAPELVLDPSAVHGLVLSGGALHRGGHGRR
jgi:hypothetical protein